MNSMAENASKTKRVPEILVVDDDPQVLKLFTTILSKQGYSVSAVTNGATAADAIYARNIDLVVLDLNMPAPDGFDLLKLFRKQKPDLPILVISGYIQGSLLEASELFGAAGSLSKLEAPGKLAETVRTLLVKERAMP